MLQHGEDSTPGLVDEEAPTEVALAPVMPWSSAEAWRLGDHRTERQVSMREWLVTLDLVLGRAELRGRFRSIFPWEHTPAFLPLPDGLRVWASVDGAASDWLPLDGAAVGRPEQRRLRRFVAQVLADLPGGDEVLARLWRGRLPELRAPRAVVLDELLTVLDLSGVPRSLLRMVASEARPDWALAFLRASPGELSRGLVSGFEVADLMLLAGRLPEGELIADRVLERLQQREWDSGPLLPLSERSCIRVAERFD